MTAHQEYEAVLVSGFVLPFVGRGRHLRQGTCPSRQKVARRRHRAAGSVRCALAEKSEGTEEEIQAHDGHVGEQVQADAKNNKTSESGTGHSVLFEGELTMDPSGALDAGLEAALSKSWDNLELFGEKKVLSSRGFEMPSTVERLGKDENEEEVLGDERGTEQGYGSEADSIEESNNVLVEDQKAGDDRGAPDEITFLEPAQVSASDEAVQSIEEAKTKTKRKKRSTAKAKTSAKKSTAAKRKSKKGAKPEKEPVLTQEDDDDSVEWDPEPRWFFVQVKPGCEQSCAISIRNMTQSLELDIQEVLVPTTTIMRLTKSGKSVKKEERLFPSYILVLMPMSSRTYGEILRIPNVQWFMGDPNRDKAKDQPFRAPLPVSDAEMRIVFEKVKTAGSVVPEVKTVLRPGDSIEVISGVFEGKRGSVVEVKPDLNIVVAKLRVFARDTSAELELHQVQVVPEESENSPVEAEGSSSEISGAKSKKKVAPSSKREASNWKDTPSAGVASVADDLAQLLSDVADSDGSDGEEHADYLQGEKETFSFMDDTKKSKSTRHVRPNKRLGDEREKLSPAQELSRLFGDDDDYDDDDFSFLDDIGKESEVKGSSAKSIAKTGSEEGLISSEDDLALFLSNDNETDLWEPSEEAAVVKPQREEGDLDSELGVEQKDGDDDLFAFLEDDDFEEADIVPDGSEEPAPNSSAR